VFLKNSQIVIMKYFLLVSIIFILLNCSTKYNLDDKSYITVDFEKAVTREMDLNEVADSLKFTFLQYDKQNLVGRIINYRITKNYIFLVDQQQKFFIYKKNGDLVTVIHNRGKGPSEYIDIEDFTIDSNEEYIYILDPGNSKVLKYNIYGTFMNGYSIPYTHAAHISNHFNGNYCIYQSARFSEKSFNVFITDSNFNTINSIKDPGGQLIKNIPYLLDVLWYNYNEYIHYKEVLVDTVFRIKKNFKSEPHILFNLGKYKMPDKYYTETKYYQMGAHKFYQIGSLLESKEYIFISIFFNNKKRYFLYQKNNRLLLNLNTDALVENSRNLDINFWPAYIDEDDRMYRFIEAGELHKKLKSTSKVNEIKHILEFNDNPVLISSKLIDKYLIIP
jgi:hypothetical protein